MMRRRHRCVALALLLGLVAGGASGPAQTVVLPTLTPLPWPSSNPISAGRVPQALAVLDFDHDGRDDLAVSASFSDAVFLLRNTGDGFVNTTELNVGPQPTRGNDLPRQLVAADVNRDGRDDLAVVNSGLLNAAFPGLSTHPSLAVLLGAPGGFQPPVYPPLWANNETPPVESVALVSTDINRDNLPDLIVGHFRDGTYTVLLGQPNSLFAPPKRNGAPRANAGLRALQADDVDGDGQTELIFALEQRLEIATLSPNGVGGPPTLIETGAQFFDLALHDLDQNGLLDLAAVEGNNVFVTLWFDLTPQGGYRERKQLALNIANTESFGSALAVADYNDDCHPDIAVAVSRKGEGNEAGRERLAVFLNDGAGAFRRVADQPLPGREARDIVPLLADGDHAVDVAIASQGDRQTGYEANPDVTVLFNPLPQQPPTQVTVLGDGPLMDMAAFGHELAGAAQTSDGEIYFVVGDAAGTIYRKPPGGPATVHVQLAALVNQRYELVDVAAADTTKTLYALDAVSRAVIRIQAPASGAATLELAAFPVGPLTTSAVAAIALHPARQSLFVAGPRRIVELGPLPGPLGVLQTFAIDASLAASHLLIEPESGMLLALSSSQRRALRLAPAGAVTGRVSLRLVVPHRGRILAALPGNAPDTIRLWLRDTAQTSFFRDAHLGFAPLPDIDGDSIPDALEFLQPPPGRTHRYLDDSDNDGLSDGVEDANRNGLHDPSETHARRRDSDNDRIIDGIEVLITHTNPLAPAVQPVIDQDRDLLPASVDGNDAAADRDGDRFLDGYEAAYFGALHAVLDAAFYPPLGDANGDKAVSNVDALITQSLFLGNIDHLAPVFRRVGFRHVDVNSDGNISNVDALIMQSYFLGNLGQLPVPLNN